MLIVVTDTMARWNYLYGRDKGTKVFHDRRPIHRAWAVFIWYVSDRVLLYLRVPSGTSIGRRAYVGALLCLHSAPLIVPHCRYAQQP